MITVVPYLIDGNNLMHAVSAVGEEVNRRKLCELLAALVELGERVCVVFDGPPPAEGAAGQIDKTGVTVDYAVGRSADAVILERIAADTAPRRLTVVSSDREIRKPARRRRCLTRTSEDFARILLRLGETRRRRRALRPSEPKEKRHGLSPEQARYWLREFGLEE